MVVVFIVVVVAVVSVVVSIVAAVRRVVCGCIVVVFVVVVAAVVFVVVVVAVAGAVTVSLCSLDSWRGVGAPLLPVRLSLAAFARRLWLSPSLSPSSIALPPPLYSPSLLSSPVVWVVLLLTPA